MGLGFFIYLEYMKGSMVSWFEFSYVVREGKLVEINIDSLIYKEEICIFVVDFWLFRSRIVVVCLDWVRVGG